MLYLSASAVVIHYEEALYQVYAHLSLPLPLTDCHSTDLHCTLTLLTKHNDMFDMFVSILIRREIHSLVRQQTPYSGQRGQQMHSTFTMISIRRGIPRPSDSPSIARSQVVDAAMHMPNTDYLAEIRHCRSNVMGVRRGPKYS